MELIRRTPEERDAYFTIRIAELISCVKEKDTEIRNILSVKSSYEGTISDSFHALYRNGHNGGGTIAMGIDKLGDKVKLLDERISKMRNAGDMLFRYLEHAKEQGYQGGLDAIMAWSEACAT